MNAILWAWFVITAAAVLVWTSRHFQLSKASRAMPPLDSSMYSNTNGTLPTISMLVAAKDEEANIGTCLQSLLQQDYPHLELIAIDDRSGDRTPDIIDRLAAGDKRLSAIHVKQLREGWFGKNNAMREGVELAEGEWLCFTDADCEFTSPRALTVAMRYAQEKRADFLSVLPTHQANSFWERLIQPACSGILMIWFNPLRVNNPRSAAAYANGAFMLMRRSCYERIGGHEPVKTELNEDIHMARYAKAAGQRLVVVSNQDLYTVRMYASLKQIWAGWSRIFFGCFGTLQRLLLSVLVITMFSMLPWIGLVSGLVAILTGSAAWPGWHYFTWLAGAACLAQISVMLRFYALNHSGPLYGLLYPVGAVFGLGALLNAIRRVGGRKTTTWRGTTYRGSRVATAAETQA
ncbi:MAG TPA: glycosyltransferase family 2 protein [Phycisphaerae bacterium]|nr:glycosyltransferase family 2 protein [Phycisphaerae bacterium]